MITCPSIFYLSTRKIETSSIEDTHHRYFILSATNSYLRICLEKSKNWRVRIPSNFPSKTKKREGADLNITPRLTAPTCIYIYIYTCGSVQIAGSCTGRPLGICIRNATTLASSAVGVAAKDEEPADCRTDGRASGWRNEWGECACVGGTRGSYTCFNVQLARLENEGQSSPGLRAGEDKSRGNERVNWFAACTTFSNASFPFLHDFRWIFGIIFGEMVFGSVTIARKFATREFFSYFNL